MATVQLQADLLSIIVQVTFWTSAMFVVAVSSFWPWWRSPFGRAVITIDVLLAAGFLPAELRRLFGISVTSTGFTWFEIVVLGLIPIRTAWLAWSLFRVQRQALPGHPDPGQPAVSAEHEPA